MNENEFQPDAQEDDPNNYRVTLELDDGQSLECAILTIFEVAKQDYIVLVPVDENDEPVEEGDVYIYRYAEDENGEPVLSNLESDEEYEKVAERFDELLDDQEFQSMDD